MLLRSAIAGRLAASRLRPALLACHGHLQQRLGACSYYARGLVASSSNPQQQTRGVASSSTPKLRSVVVRAAAAGGGGGSGGGAAAAAAAGGKTGGRAAAAAAAAPSSFAELGLSEAFVTGLASQGITRPTEVQVRGAVSQAAPRAAWSGLRRRCGCRCP